MHHGYRVDIFHTTLAPKLEFENLYIFVTCLTGFNHRISTAEYALQCKKINVSE